MLSAVKRKTDEDQFLIPDLRKRSVGILQVNLGDLCNQSCFHCHVDAGPNHKKIMSGSVVDRIISFLRHDEVKTLDLTGGAPELNPHFKYLVTNSRSLVDRLIVRCNLTVIFEPDMDFLPRFYRESRVELTCSLPCYLEENVDRQRGRGTYQKSIKALKLLNEIGYGRPESGLVLNLVYNPGGPSIPGDQQQLETAYKRELKKRFGIEFNRLFCMTNMPINRFKRELISNGNYNRYLSLLRESHNPDTHENLMCLDQINVGYNGAVYDCDFNQMSGLQLVKSGKPLFISQTAPRDLIGRYVILDDHCLGCTAGTGSSCTGTLT